VQGARVWRIGEENAGKVCFSGKVVKNILSGEKKERRK